MGIRRAVCRLFCFLCPCRSAKPKSTREAVLCSVRERVQRTSVSSQILTASQRVIGTHSGRFHCDEALACGLLLHTPSFRGSSVVRTRNPDILAKADVVVDVGGVYDHSIKRYDHHQKTFSTMMKTDRAQYEVTKLSSAGLIYLHYGKILIKEFCEQFAPEFVESTDLLYDKMYKDFVQHVDAVDNGVEQCEGTFEKRYHIPNTLASRIDSLNPRWNEEITDEICNANFQKAVLLATSEFYEKLEYYCMSWLPARKLVIDAFATAQQTDYPEIIIISAGGVPWKEHLFDIEKEAGKAGKTLYTLFPEPNGDWKVIAVPEKLGGFSNRMPLPWKGLRDGDLDKASGIDGCIFVHASGFIGGNRTYEGVVAMAKKAIELGWANASE